MLLDHWKRPLQDLRISVTDRCNYRCSYCMPLEEYEWIPKQQLLQFEEITRIARIAVGLGVQSIRLTGGEPLLRRDLPRLVEMLAAIEGLDDLSLTTNGERLARLARDLKQAGLQRINVSLDTLDARRHAEITRRGDLAAVHEGLERARDVGLLPIKINMVVERGVNEDEIPAMLEFCQRQGFSLRYIEYMDVGNANGWHFDKVVSQREILSLLQPHLATADGRRPVPSDPAELFPLRGGGDVGVIGSVSEPFCGACSRARLTASGQLVTCLFASRGHDLRDRLRSGATDAEITRLLEGIWTARRDRYSEERLAAIRASGYDPDDHEKFEMISLGG